MSQKRKKIELYFFLWLYFWHIQSKRIINLLSMFTKKHFIIIALCYFYLGLASAAPYKMKLPQELQSKQDSVIQYLFNDDYKNAYNILEDIKLSYKYADDKYIQAVINYWEGRILGALRYFNKAESLLENAARYFEQSNNINDLGATYYSLGYIYELREDNPTLELSYFQKALQYHTIAKDTNRILRSYDAMGCVYMTLGKLDEAIKSSLMAETIMLTNPQKYLEPNIYTNLSDQYYKLQDYEKAKFYAQKVVDYYDYGASAGTVSAKYEAYKALGRALIGLGNQSAGFYYLEKSLEYAQKNPNNHLFTKEIYDFFINDAQNKGDFKKAFDLQQEYSNIRDKMATEALTMRMSQNETILEIKRRENAQELLKSEQKENKFMWFFAILVSCLFIAVTFLYVQHRNFSEFLKKEVEQQTKELREKNAELERFTYSTAHDLRTPIRNIMSFATLMCRKMPRDIDDEIRLYLGFIKDYAQSLDKLVNDIADFSKIGKNDAMPVCVDLETVKENVLKELKNKIEARRATIRIESNLPQVNGSRIEMQQLLQNLIENAITFNESPRPEIIIGYDKNSAHEKHIFIKDNGIGIAPEYQDKVFDMFTRLNSPDKYPGSGLGLAICKKIVTQYGGRIWLDSQKGSGTTVHIALPAA